MRRFLVASVIATLLATAALQAQAAKAPDDLLAKLLFPPELVLKHAQELGLQPAQRTAIVAAIKEVQGDLLDLQLEMAERAEALVKLMDVPRVDEAGALAQADKVMGLERDMKRKQLQLLVRIKNVLTPEQQDRLRSLRTRQGDGEGLQ